MDNPFEAILDKLVALETKVGNLVTGPGTEPPEIINTEELCRRLDISEPTAIKWRRRKKIPSFTIGSAVRYNWPAVVKFLESKNSK